MPGYSSYRGSKLGATKVFEIFGHEQKDDSGSGIRVMQIHPGLIGGTGMSAKFEASASGLEWDDGEFFVFFPYLTTPFTR